MLGGVCGHAGLFANAYDLARLMHMLRMGGSYGGIDWFEPETVVEWTKRVDEDPEFRKEIADMVMQDWQHLQQYPKFKENIGS